MEFTHEWDPAEFSATHAAEIEADPALAEMVASAVRRCASTEYVAALASARDLAPKIERAISDVRRIDAETKGLALDPIKDRIVIVTMTNAQRELVRLMDGYERAAAVLDVPRLACLDRVRILAERASRARWESENPDAHEAEQTALDHARAERIAALAQGRAEG